MSKRKLLELVQKKAGRRAGTIRACRRWPGCGGAATRPRRSAPSASASAWPRPTASSTWACSSTALREDLNRRCPRVMARAAAAQGGDRELPRGRGARARRAAAPGGSVARARARCRSRACSTSSATTSARIRPRTGSAWRRAARCACATPASSRCTDVIKDAARRGRRAALHVGSGVVGRQRARRAHGARHAALGVGGARRRRPRCASTIACSPSRIPGTTEGKSFLDEINPESLVSARDGRSSSRTWRRAQAGRALSVRAARLLLRRRDSTPASWSGTAR